MFIILITYFFVYLIRIIIKNVPVGVADFPHEVLRSPKAFAKDKFKNLVHYTEMPRGGHFPAFEQPKLMTDDIRKFVKTCLINEQNQKDKAEDNKK